MIKSVKMELAGKTLLIENGKLAKQAQGSVWVRYGDSVILATVCVSKEPKENVDFLPLIVEYREKTYAIGKIPGNFFRREGRPNEKETLSARQIDRPLRPLFPKEYHHDVQIIVNVLSADQEHDVDVLGVIGASAAIGISPIPIEKSVAAVHVGRINGEYVLNPTYSQLEDSEINLVVAGTKDSILMVEGSVNELSEEICLGAIEVGYEAIIDICELQDQLFAEVGVEKQEFLPKEKNEELFNELKKSWQKRINETLTIADKDERSDVFDKIAADAIETLSESYEDEEENIREYLSDMQRDMMRDMILTQNRRVDGREPDDIRDLSCEIGVLPRTHGSALFTRGQTQSLVVTTLGTKVNERMIDDLEGVNFKSYMLDYNFPPYSVGEVRMLRGTSRREIGHGHLAERALHSVIPKDEDFPYTIRIVSDILESNGSSSMATVCGGSLSLMDAGVPIKCNIAGVAMGLIKENDRIAILTDILGLEDYLGDMDFKIAGSREGITAVQMDIKIPGISSQILQEALDKARIARMKILDAMDQTISTPKSELSKFAPKILTLNIRPDQIGLVIGSGGKTVRSIQEETGVTIDIQDDGTVTVASVGLESVERAKQLIEGLIEEPEIGKVYEGTVKRTVPFGAFIEIIPGKDGLCHISELENYRVNRVEDVLKINDSVQVKVIGIDDQGKVKLSRKALLKRN